MRGATKMDLDPQIGQLIWTDELIRAFWDGVGCTHLDDLSFGKLAGPKFLHLIREHMPAGAEICDFGAGGGHFAELLLKDGFATGVYEPSPRRGETLRDKLSVYDRFLGVIGPDDSRLFDVVIMAEVIEHVPDRALGQMLERVRRLLRRGGIVIVTTPNDENIGQAEVFCPVCRHTFHPWQHVRSFTHESLERQLEEYGFARRFVGLVDFSDDAAAIDRSRLLPLLIEFIKCLGRELTEFGRHLPPDDFRKEASWAAGSVYATDNLQFGHRLILAEIAKLCAQTKGHIREISWPGGEEALPEVLMQLCDELYSRLGALIGTQQRQTKIQEMSIESEKMQAKIQEMSIVSEQRQAQIQQLKNAIADIVGRSRSAAVSGMGIAARVEQQGLGFLRSPGSKVYWSARFCWEFLRHPALLAEIISMPSALAEQTQAVSAISRVAESSDPEKTEPGVPGAAPPSGEGVGLDEAAGRIDPGDNGTADRMSGATAAVCVHLRSIAERIQHALGTFTSSHTLRAELGYDLYLGRGSNILYIGEKV